MRAMLSLKHCLVLLALFSAPAAWADSKPEKPPTPPSEAQWTIQCRTFAGENRVAEAMRARDELRKQTHEKTWYLLHGERETTLYYGYYRCVQVDGSQGSDLRDAERAHADRKRIAALRPEFADAYFVPVDSVGEEGPREWNITNTPPESRWTLLIGVYRDTPERKRAAVDAVRKLRSEKVDAYYFHTDSSSYVYVGCWEASAVLREEADTSRLSQGADEEVMVTDREFDPSVPTLYRGPDGKMVRLASARTLIQNENVKEMKAKFPNFHINGEVMGRRITDPKTRQERLAYDESVITTIPRRERSVLSSDRPTQPPAVQLVKPSAAPTKGSGTLKSLDE